MPEMSAERLDAFRHRVQYHFDLGSTEVMELVDEVSRLRAREKELEAQVHYLSGDEQMEQLEEVTT